MCNLVWWAQELSFKHVLETARTHTARQQASFLQKSVSGFCLPILAMPSQFYSQPFGMSPPRFREPNPQVQWTWPLSPPSNLVGIASDLANLADLAVTNLLRDL